MALPTPGYPTFELELPSNGKTVKYRPFLVKEEKVLLLALESQDEKQITSAVKDLIKNCVISRIKVDNLPSFDLEYLFLQIRSKSVGEVVEFNTKCEKCNHTIPVSVDISNLVPDMSNCPDKLIPLLLLGSHFQLLAKHLLEAYSQT